MRCQIIACQETRKAEPGPRSMSALIPLTFAERAQQPVRKLLVHLQIWMRAWDTRRQLEILSDRQLEDIGLRRSEIGAVARHAALQATKERVVAFSSLYWD